jgi:hypothetical protein
MTDRSPARPRSLAGEIAAFVLFLAPLAALIGWSV